jgi:hypothetical protein
MAVSTKVLFNGNNLYHVILRSISTGTDETDVTKIDRSTLIGPDQINPPARIQIQELTWNVNGFDEVSISWNFGTDEIIHRMTGDNYVDYRPSGGLVPGTVPSDLTSTDGDIILSTVGAAANDTYDIYILARLT